MVGRSSDSSVGWRPERNTSKVKLHWLPRRSQTRHRWRRRLTARSLNLFCHQRFSPVHSMAGNLAPHTPAWTFSSILASTKPFARRCRRRWHPACRSSPPMPGVRAISCRTASPDFCFPARIRPQGKAEPSDQLLSEAAITASARRSVLGRTWPVICEQLMAHYLAVQEVGLSEHAAKPHEVSEQP